MKKIQLLSILMLASGVEANGPVAYHTASWYTFSNPCWTVSGTVNSKGGLEGNFIPGQSATSSRGSVDLSSTMLSNEDYLYMFTATLSTASTGSSCKQTHAHSFKIERNADTDYTGGFSAAASKNYQGFVSITAPLGTAWKIYVDSSVTADNKKCKNKIVGSNVSSLSSSSVSSNASLCWETRADNKESLFCHIGSKVVYVAS